MHLLYFNKSEADIWCRNKFDEISSSDPRFSITHILSEPNESWNGETGRIRKELITDIIKNKLISFTLYCGNAGFNEQSRVLLSEFSNMEIHGFEG